MATVIRKAIIKEYDATSHTATVQIAGSLGVWLDAIRVATDIPAADVVAGRQCTVLFLDPANQDDAVVITIQGALPSGGGGGVTDHGALTGLADDDHTQYGALAQAETWAALQTFSAGLKLAAAQQIQDSGGTGRLLLATASPHVALTGNLDVSGFVAIGNNASVGTASALTVGHQPTLGSFGTFWGTLSAVNDIGSGAVTALSAIGFEGQATNKRSAGTLLLVEGLFFQAGHQPTAASTTSTLRGMRIRPSITVTLGTATTMIGATIEFYTAVNAPAPTTVYAFQPTFSQWSGNNPGTLYAYHCPTLPAVVTASFFAFWGDATTPHFQVEGANPSNLASATEANSPLLLLFNENGTLTVRRTRCKQQSTLAAADKVLIAV